jgi:cytochrome c2
MRRLSRYVSFAIGFFAATSAVAAGDPAKGQAVFTHRCGDCHALGQDKIGPHLAGVVGRKAGSVAGFKYSTAMKGYGRPWSASALDTFLTDPAAAVPGAYMTPSLSSPAGRADVIAYLKTAR